MDRIGPWIAAIWLFFLVDPLQTGWAERDQFEGVLGIAATVSFAVLYLVVWTRMRVHRLHLLELRAPLRSEFMLFVPLVALSASMVACLGQDGTMSFVFLGVAAQVLFPFRVALPLGLAVALAAVLLGHWMPGWESGVGLALATLAAFLAVSGVTLLLRRNIDLVRAQEENARLVIDNERNRFARDLHDILGHSLTVITVKAELAGRLLDVDPDRARAEVADLERLSRDALADVRRAVHGYRELTLPGEIARAGVALEAAQISAELPNAADEVPTEARELFAWTLREGVTNVIRHSHAAHCCVRLGTNFLEVRDDGRGSDQSADRGPGQGLIGLRERAGLVGATIVTRTLDPGFSLEVRLR